MNVLVTGANGFIGRNLVAWLERLPDVHVLAFDRDNYGKSSTRSWRSPISSSTWRASTARRPRRSSGRATSI